jgi:Sulfotransferase family
LFPVANANPYANSELFGVVRDPYDRMVSEFYYICTLSVFDWRPNQCNRKKLGDQKYMNEWLAYKLEDRNRHSALDYLMDNGHFTPQYEFVFGPNEVRMLDYVLQMDDLTTQFPQLMSAFGLNRVHLEKRNAIGATNRGESQTHLEVKHLAKTALGAIHNAYPHDFALGPYTKHVESVRDEE